MLLSITTSLALLATFVVAQPHDILISTHVSRQTTDSPPKDCNATCGAFQDVQKACNVKHCGCNTRYLQAQGECLLCQSDTPLNAAEVQMFLDSEMSQCHEEGIPITFKLQLPPDAQVFVDDFDRQNVGLRQQQTVFLALQIVGGHIGLVIVLCHAVFTRKVHRDPMFINFCITWILSSVIYAILLYHGTKENTIVNSLGRVNPNICLAQAALTNGAQVMTAGSTMALVIQLWTGLHASIHGDLTGPKQRKWLTLILLAMPYVFIFVFAISTIFVGKMHVNIVGASVQRATPTNFYCSVIDLSSLLQVVYGVTLGLLIITVFFDVLIINMLYRHWWAFRHIQVNTAMSLSSLLRIILFSIYRIVVAVVYATLILKPPQGHALIFGGGVPLSATATFGVQPWVDMLQAAIPLVASIVLGLNTDMVTSLMFWRRNKRTLPSVMTNATNTNYSHLAQAGRSTTRSELATLEGDTKDANDHV